MKSLTKIVATIAMAASLALASTSAFSGEDNNAKVRAAAETTLAKLQEAVNLAESGSDKAAILAALGEARQSQKEFRYEATERSRQKGNNNLVAAREAFDKGDTAHGKDSLKKALDIFTEMKKVYDSAH
ncbi:MAG: hypothetical protein ABL925_12960 [Methylococcales bacterium]